MRKFFFFCLVYILVCQDAWSQNYQSELHIPQNLQNIPGPSALPPSFADQGAAHLQSMLNNMQSPEMMAQQAARRESMYQQQYLGQVLQNKLLLQQLHMLQQGQIQASPSPIQPNPQNPPLPAMAPPPANAYMNQLSIAPPQ